jgi:hypothetical protein
MQISRRTAMLTVLAIALLTAGTSRAGVGPADLRAAYHDQVDRRLTLPHEEAARYGDLALDALARAGISLQAPQYLVLVDRSPNVQAILLFRVAAAAPPELIGASPVSTGRGGAFDHFETPLGVFPHSPSNPDFRAEGTRNENGIRGYGDKGMRVFDLGWQQAERLWGNGGTSTMRLQMHATDRELLEPRLGSVQSKGCIRIPASLNRLLDHFGALDADYLAAAADEPEWVLPEGQTPVDAPGRYIIVVETERQQRPAWSARP